MRVRREDEAQHPIDSAQRIVDNATAVLRNTQRVATLDPVVMRLLAAQVEIGVADFDRKLFVLELEDIMRRYTLLTAVPQLKSQSAS